MDSTNPRIASTPQQQKKSSNNTLIIAVVVGLIALIAAIGGFFWWQQATTSEGTEAFARESEIRPTQEIVNGVVQTAEEFVDYEGEITFSGDFIDFFDPPGEIDYVTIG